MPKEPIFKKYLIEAGNLTRGLVSCTGAQFCGVAMIETKNRAMAIVEKLEQQLDLPKKVRMHWTGCPNSCGQVGSTLHIDELPCALLITQQILCEHSEASGPKQRAASYCVSCTTRQLAVCC